jgi:hypothetical protein
MAETCITFAVWMPLALLASLGIGVLIGTHIRFVIDRAELAAYRRVARLPISGEAQLDETMRELKRVPEDAVEREWAKAREYEAARQQRERARRIAD